MQETHSIPRWQKILGGIFTAFMVLMGVWGIYQALAAQWFDRRIWSMFLLFLLLRLLLAAIPLWKSHRQWLEDAQKKDAETGGSQYAAAQAADQMRRNRLIGLGVGGGVLVIVSIAVLCRVLYAQAHPRQTTPFACLPPGSSATRLLLIYPKRCRLWWGIWTATEPPCAKSSKRFSVPIPATSPPTKCETALFRAPIR